MSFLGRKFIFKCDFCTCVIDRSEYGLPKGWFYLREKQNTLHSCEICSQNLIGLGAKSNAEQKGHLEVTKEMLVLYPKI